MTAAVSFSIPYPPSVNAIYSRGYGNGSNVRRSDDYKKWLQMAGWTLLQQLTGLKKPVVRGAVLVGYRVRRPSDKRKHDLGNLLKALDDLLVLHKVIEDDSLIEGYEPLRWDNSVDGVLVTIRACDTSGAGQVAA